MWWQNIKMTGMWGLDLMLYTVFSSCVFGQLTILIMVKLSVSFENITFGCYGLEIKWPRRSQVSVSYLCLSSAFYWDLIFHKLFVTSFQVPKINFLVSGKGRVESSAQSQFWLWQPVMSSGMLLLLLLLSHADCYSPHQLCDFSLWMDFTVGCQSFGSWSLQIQMHGVKALDKVW